MIIILEGHFDDLVQWLILTYSMKAGVLDIHRWFYTVNTKMVKSQNKREQCYNLTRIVPGMRNTIHVCTKQVQLLFQQWMHSQILGCSQKSALGSMWTLGQIAKLTCGRREHEYCWAVVSYRFWREPWNANHDDVIRVISVWTWELNLQ